MLMSGSSMRFCRLMKATSAITPIRIGTQIDSSAAPASEAFEKPSSKKPNPSAERTVSYTHLAFARRSFPVLIMLTAFHLMGGMGLQVRVIKDLSLIHISPMIVVSPMITPIAWSMKKRRPICAPG